MEARKNVSGFFVGRVLLAKADLVEQEEVKESCQNIPINRRGAALLSLYNKKG
jgi:hypothetical protein